MERRVLVVSAISAVVFWERTHAQSKEIPNGIWTFTTGRNANGTGSSDSQKYFSILRRGEVLTIKDLETGTEVPARVQNNRVRIASEVSGMPKQELLFEASFEQGRFVGNAVSSAGSQPFLGIRLTAVWRCSNHSPRHISKSKDEMVENTKARQCEGWERLQG